MITMLNVIRNPAMFQSCRTNKCGVLINSRNEKVRISYARQSTDTVFIL